LTEEVLVATPNLEALRLARPVVRDGFLLLDLNGSNVHKKLFPSLRWLYLEAAQAVDDNWDPLITYLTRQTSDDQVVLLSIFGEGVHVCLEVIKRMEGLVGELIYVPDPRKKCPFGKCP